MTRPSVITRRLWRILPLSMLLAACAGPPTSPSTGPSRPANVHPGFDTSRFPGERAMQAWREASPYRWVGYYLPSPCRRDTSWSGQRAALERMGWGTAILYVGQQTWDNAPESAGPPPAVILCSRTLLTEEQGRADARDAAARAQAEGFPPGSVIFLDVERMQRIPPAMIAYYQAWIREVITDGRYRPGTYAHRANAAELNLLAQTAATQAGRSLEVPFWVAGGSGFSLDRAPNTSGLPFADVWQGALDVQRTWGGVSLLIDENTASGPSPSAPNAT